MGPSRHKRNIYLDNKPWEEALELYLKHLDRLGALKPVSQELIHTEKALQRVTAAPVFARTSSPHYHSAAMDGFAALAASTFNASEIKPVRLKVGADVFPVDTGDPLPAGCDAVIMIEDVHFVRKNEIEIIHPVYPWQHVREIGEDIVATEMIIPSNHRVRPVDIGGLLAGGVIKIVVYSKPVVVLIPTGNELVEPGAELKPGNITEYNTLMLGAMIEEWGGVVRRFPIVPDDPGALEKALFDALEVADLVLINAGSSAGSEDYTAEVISRVGNVFVHGVATKPGKPVILGAVNNKPVIGVPGYPVSAFLCTDLFVKPVLYRKSGTRPPEREKVTAVISRKIVSSPGTEDFVRVRLGRVGEKIIATPVSRGAGVIMSLLRADGIVRVPRFTEGFHEEEEVEVELLRCFEEVQETTVIIGSHDNALDILANHFRLVYPQASLSSAHVGSLAGLNALKRNEAHCAGMHLLDEESGEYNVAYIKRFLPGRNLILVNLVYREQGLIVKKGNPKKIRNLTDLTRPDVAFINRQRGAGTRVLLDYRLKVLGIRPEEIRGYEREKYTHLAVAAAVAAGEADSALGIRAAASALNLDFIPLAEERYDLCIPKNYWDTPYIQRLLEVIGRPAFQKDVRNLGGYDLRDCGKIVWSKNK